MNKKKRRPDALMAYVGVMVEVYRSDAGLSLGQLAKKVGIHRNTLALIEQGEQNVTLGTLGALASVMKCAPADLLPDRAVDKHLKRRHR